MDRSISISNVTGDIKIDGNLNGVVSIAQQFATYGNITVGGNVTSTGTIDLDSYVNGGEISITSNLAGVVAHPALAMVGGAIFLGRAS